MPDEISKGQGVCFIRFLVTGGETSVSQAEYTVVNRIGGSSVLGLRNLCRPQDSFFLGAIFVV